MVSNQDPHELVPTTERAALYLESRSSDLKGLCGALRTVSRWWRLIGAAWIIIVAFASLGWISYSASLALALSRSEYSDYYPSNLGAIAISVVVVFGLMVVLGFAAAWQAGKFQFSWVCVVALAVTQTALGSMAVPKICLVVVIAAVFGMIGATVMAAHLTATLAIGCLSARIRRWYYRYTGQIRTNQEVQQEAPALIHNPSRFGAKWVAGLRANAYAELGFLGRSVATAAATWYAVGLGVVVGWILNHFEPRRAPSVATVHQIIHLAVLVTAATTVFVAVLFMSSLARVLIARFYRLIDAIVEVPLSYQEGFLAGADHYQLAELVQLTPAMLAEILSAHFGPIFHHVVADRAMRRAGPVITEATATGVVAASVLAGFDLAATEQRLLADLAEGTNLDLLMQAGARVLP
jgi:hypothetical protein